MRKSILRGILLLSVLLPAITHAANYQINVPGSPVAAYPCDWSGTEAIAVSNGVAYAVVNYGNTSKSGLWYYNTVTQQGGIIATGATNNGHCIATDSNRNLVFAYGSDPNHNTETQLKSFRVYKAKSSFGELINTAEYKDLDLSKVFNAFTEYTYYFSASGNLWDGTGYLYFTNGSKAVRITVDSIGEGVTQDVVTLPDANTTEPNRDMFALQPDGNYLFHLRVGDTTVPCKVISDCVINWDSQTISVGASSNYYMLATKGLLQGKEVFVHPNGIRNSTLDATAVKPLIVEVDGRTVTIDSHPDKTGAGKGAFASVNAWTAFEQVDDNTIGLYIYSPRNNGNSCVSRYNITATELSGETVVSTAWTQAASGTASTNPVRFQQPAVSPNGYLYLPGGNSTIVSETFKGFHVFGDGVSTVISSGGSSLGFGGAFDDNNHYVFHGAFAENQESYNAAPTTLRVKRPCADNPGTGEYPYTLMGNMENNNTIATLNLGDYAPGIVAKYFDVTGDVATEGHVWWIPNETYSDAKLKLYCTEISNWAASDKFIIELASLYGLNTASTGNNYVQFYDTSDPRRYRALVQLHGNGLYDAVINLTDRKSVTTTRIPDSSVANYMNTGAHIFMLNGHKLLARSVENAGLGSQANPTKFEIVDITDINNIKTIAIIQPSFGNNIKNGGSNVGTWLQSRKIDEKTVELWAYGAGCGVEVYTVTANITDGATMVLYGRIEVDKSEQDNRQDAVLSWTMPAGYEVEEYRVYCTEEYTSTYNGNTLDKTYYVGSTTSNTITHKDLHWIKGSSDWYKQTYTYMVYPVLADGSIGANGRITLTPDFLPCPPVWTTILTYDGYQKAQIYWSAPSWGQAPNFYNVYRDGVKLNDAPILNYNYLDTQIPTGPHTYYVEGFYLEDSSEWETSTLYNRNDDRTATIAARDPLKSTYSIEEVYNYRIGSGSDEVKPQGVYSNMIDEKFDYGQAEYHQGYWYLAQLIDANGTYSRILKLNADKDKILTQAATEAVKYSTSHGGWSRGVAMDDGGNIFVRRGGISSNGSTYTTTDRLQFYRELGAGSIYLRNADGSYSQTPITVDLSQCEILDFDTQYDRFEPINNIFYGRVEYFNITGDLSAVGGEAYLWVSASGSKRSNKIKLTRTSSAAITATLVDKVDITLADRLTREDFAVGVENYVFPVKYLKTNSDGTKEEAYRSDYIHNLRSRVYANIKPTGNPNDLADVQATIYDTQSRVNNAGGCTIGWNDEIFLITPQCPYSQNSGNFYVSMGDRAKYDASGNVVIDETTKSAVMLDAESADLTKPIPVAQFTQDEITDGTFSNTNGNWIYAALGKLDGTEIDIDFTNPDEAECVYIYQYIPGVRFAKYRLLSNNYFPPTPVDLAISSVYGKTQYRDDDLVGYKGTAKFGVAKDVTTSGNMNYKIESYTYVFKDAAGTDVWTYTVKPDGSYTYTRVKDGVTTTGSGSGALIDEEYTDINGDKHSAYFTFEHPNLKRDISYQSTVTVNYVNTTDVTDTHTSETTIDEDMRTYTPEAADPESVTVYTGKAGTSVEGVYRVEVNFDAPGEVGHVTEEPVSYYQVIVKKPMSDGSVITDTIKGFELMVKETPDRNGGKCYDYVPGNYDFDANEGTRSEGGETSMGESTLIYYHKAAEGESDPSKWTYTIEAVYGATNPNVTAEASADVNSQNMQDGGTTAVETVESGAQSLKVYPVPATSVLTVDAAEAIGTVTVLDISGAVVMTANGDGGSSLTLNISHLAPGYYFLEINHGTVVRVIKR